jgi:putative phosphoesterase
MAARKAKPETSTRTTRTSKASKFAPKPVVANDTLALRDGALHLVIVADTHSHPDPRSLELIAAERPDYILHAGDIGDLGVVEELSRIAPTIAVRGNIDVHTAGLPDVMTLDVCDGEQTLIKMLLLHIAVYGPKLRGDAAQLARGAGASIVLCGHSHVPFWGKDKGFTVFNPGSIGPRRMHLPILFGVMDVTRERISLKHVDVETGKQWLPP